MDLYTATSYELAERMTKRYSTSFAMSSSLFDANIRPHIYAVYGMVRIADEIVDTYRGIDAREQLAAFQQEVHEALAATYCTNPILHAFADTCRKYSIGADLIDPFFDSMRMDLAIHTYTQKDYERYIYGSAEVVGLMCLKVFVDGDRERYDGLRSSAQALGAAYQKVNFLRDIAADYKELGRVYFPGVEFDAFDDHTKEVIQEDIARDFSRADEGIAHLPEVARRAVALSRRYYGHLLQEISRVSAREIKTRRVRVSNVKKVWLYMLAKVHLV